MGTKTKRTVLIIEADYQRLLAEARKLRIPKKARVAFFCGRAEDLAGTRLVEVVEVVP